MGTKAKSTTATKNAGDRPAKPRKRGGRNVQETQAAVVHKLVKLVETKLNDKELKASLGDFIRLLQLQKELVGEQPREITVTWVEPEEETCSE